MKDLRPAHSSSGFAAVLLILPSALIAMSAMHVVSRHRIRTLVADQWNIYGGYLSEDPLSALFAATNGHRMVVPGLAILADLRWFNLDNAVLHWITLLAALAFTALFCAASLRAPLSPMMRAALVSVCLSLVFWLGNREQFTSPLNGIVNYPLLALLLASFLAFHRAVSGPASGRRALEPARLALALSLAAAANFTFGIGNVVWPVLLAGCVFLRVRPAVAIVVSVAFALCLGLYWALPDAAGIRLGGDLGWARLGRTARFAIQFCGSPATHWLEPIGSSHLGPLLPARILGVLGLAVAAFALTRAALRPRDLGGLEFASLSLMLHGVGTAVLIGLNRAYFQDGTESRYLIWSIAFWIGVAGWCALRVERSAARPTFVIFAAVLPFALAHSHLIYADRSVTRRAQIDRATLSFQVGIRDESDAKKLIGWPYVTPPLHRLVPQLRERQLSFFSDGRHALMGRDGRSLYQGPGLRQCATKHLRFIDAPDSSEPALHAHGTLEGGELGGSNVVFVDSTGRVIGLGFVPMRNRLTPWGFPKAAERQTFSGYLEAGAAEPYSGFVVPTPGGPAYCRIGPFQRG